VTVDPEQKVVVGTERETDGVTVPVSEITTCTLVAVFAVTHVAVEVSTHHIESLFASVLSVYLVEFVPTAEPFRYH
jgi:hypothetical protein